MKADPGNVQTSADRAERQPVLSAVVDWAGNGNFTDAADDISTKIGSVTIERTIQGDLPDEVTLIEGSHAAQADFDLAVGNKLDNAQHAAWYWSRFNASSPIPVQRYGRSAQVSIGFAGTTAVRRLTGTTTALSVSSTDRTGKLSIRDYREKLNAAISLPALVADVSPSSTVKPGLNSQYVIDLILRANGIYLTPPKRTGCVLSATMHGSSYPELGTIYSSVLKTPDPLAIDPDSLTLTTFSQGKFGLGLGLGPVANLYSGTGIAATSPTELVTYTWANNPAISTNNGGKIWIEFFLPDATAIPTVTSTTGATMMGAYCEDTSGTGVEIAIKPALTPSRTTVVIQWRRFSGATLESATFNLGAFTVGGYVGFGCDFKNGTVDVKLTTGGSTQSTTGTSTNVIDTQPLTSVTVAPYVISPIEGLQVTSEGTAAASTANSAWTSQMDLMRSRNELTAVFPVAGTDSWQLLKDIAAAEFAWIGFTEEGRFFYRTREYWTQTGPQTVVDTLTAALDITALEYSEAVDTIRNKVTIPVRAVQVGVTTDVWSMTENTSVPPRQTVVILASFTDPVYSVDTNVSQIVAGASNPPGVGKSRVKANLYSSGGTGTKDRSSSVVVTVTVIDSNTVSISIYNPLNSTLWIVDTTGQPCLFIAGNAITTPNAGNTTAVAQDLPSQLTNGVQSLDIPDNQWRQQYGPAQGVAADLLGRLSQPQPTITNLEVIGNPLRELGDRVRIQDPNGLALDGEFWLTGITDVFDGKYVQKVSARQATKVSVWNTFLWDDGTTWG